MIKRFLVVVSLLLVAPATRAQNPDPASAVRGYFEALGNNDFNRALSFTSGEAQTRTANMVGTLQEQAKQHRAEVTLRIKRVLVWPSPPPSADGTPVPIDVQFDIDVVGKKWMFSKVARRLAGHAQFFVKHDSSRIVAIEGKIY